MSVRKQALARTLTVCRRSPTRKLWCDPGLHEEVADALWAGPDDTLIASAQPLQVKDRCAVLRFAHARNSYLLKRHTWGPASRTARMLLREPTAHRCASLASFLVEQGVPTPRPRACLVHGLGPFRHRSYLVTDFVEGTSLFHFVRSKQLTTEVAGDLAAQVAAIWQQLIDLNISHNDLKPENFIVDRAQRVWIIDLEKTRIHHDQHRLQRQHLEDARVFLHARNWRDQPESAEIFRNQLLNTSLAGWLADRTGDDHRLLRTGYSPHELSCRISVAIVAARQPLEPQALARTIDSVDDLADEIVLVGPSAANSQFEVRETIRSSPAALKQPIEQRIPEDKKPSFRALQHPWVLVLREGECATPDLVRQLPERIVDQAEWDAGRFPLDESVFGLYLRRYRPTPDTPIRVFHQHRCQFSLQNGDLIVTVDPGRTLSLNAQIRAHVSSGLEPADYDRAAGTHVRSDAA